MMLGSHSDSGLAMTVYSSTFTMFSVAACLWACAFRWCLDLYYDLDAHASGHVRAAMVRVSTFELNQP